MTNDSTISLLADHNGTQTMTPKSSSVNFIKQFARSYAVVAGLAVNGMICN